jgi:hypothetical protein
MVERITGTYYYHLAIISNLIPAKQSTVRNVK